MDTGARLGCFDAGTELGHHQGVGAQVVEEVAVDRDAVNVQNAGQDLAERLLGRRSRFGGVRPVARIVIHRCGQDAG